MASSSTEIVTPQNFLERCIRIIKFLCHPISAIMSKVLSELDFFERFYLKLYNIYAFVSQMYFFLSCALVFQEIREDGKIEDFVLTGLKTLLFYSVFAYFVTKTRDILTLNRPSLFLNWSITEGLCRIIIEWAKAVIVVVCLREQGIHFKPSLPYAVLTFSYYLCTEKIFTEIFLKSLQYFAFTIFDDLEHLHLPLIFNIYTIVLSLAIQLYLFYTTKFTVFAFVCSYFTLYLRVKDSYCNYWSTIKLAKQTFDNFRNATQRELDEYDDVCAVCLNVMSRAKITPCNHFFHASCLKEWLKNSFFCPLCKYDF